MEAYRKTQKPVEKEKPEKKTAKKVAAPSIS
jgi:hypothetical protein